MSDTLIGVIVGGFIASIAPITSLIINHLRWRREARIEYLRGERQRRESIYKDAFHKLSKGVADGNYPMDTISDIMILMPQDVNDLFEKLMDEIAKKTGKEKFVLMEIALAIKKHFSEIENQIEDLVME